MARLGIQLIIMVLFFAAVSCPAFCEEDVRAAWVELGENGQAVARVLIKSQVCPALAVDGAETPMALRAEEANYPPFPVKTCELYLPAGVTSVTAAGRKLPLPKARPELIAVIGDTGCRIHAGKYQACNNAEEWPFKAIADRVAGLHPDLIVHAGDILYREVECPPQEGCQGSPWGNGYDAFDADFFQPAGNLLAAAPWVFVRGNHETCRRGGMGWWRFFDPRRLEKDPGGFEPCYSEKGNYSEPYAVPLGPDFQLVVFDSSRATNGFDAQTSARFEPQLKKAFDLAAQKPAFFLVHHPVLGIAPSRGKLRYYPGNTTLQLAMKAANPALFPESVQAVIGGHVHIFQAMSFQSGYPASFISGNGGTALDDMYEWREGDTPYEPAAVEYTRSAAQFGFMTLRRAGAGWQAEEYDVKGAPVLSCALRDRKAKCEPQPASGGSR